MEDGAICERCSWCGEDPLYRDYHDREWGVPERDGRALWELLVLESFQSGLSWITILRKRLAFRTAFAGFDPVVISEWGPTEVETLMGNSGIIRHRGKIEATIDNARAYLRTEREIAGGFSAHLWTFVDHLPRQPGIERTEDVPSQTPLSQEISRDLRDRGFRFCGPTTVYAFMQAAGLVNDHVTSCFRHCEIAALARREQRG